MVAPTRAKNVWIKLYTMIKETFPAYGGGTTQAVVGTPILLTSADAGNYAYHRVYRNGVKIACTSVVGQTYTFAAGAASDTIEIVYPAVLKTDLRIQQSIEYATDAKTDDWEELDTTVVTTDLVSRKGSGSLKLLRNDKTEIALIEGYADTAQLCMLAIQDAKSDLTKAERTILLEVQFTGSKGSVSVGGKQEETYSFTFKAPVSTMAIA